MLQLPKWCYCHAPAWHDVSCFLPACPESWLHAGQEDQRWSFACSGFTGALQPSESSIWYNDGLDTLSAHWVNASPQVGPDDNGFQTVDPTDVIASNIGDPGVIVLRLVANAADYQQLEEAQGGRAAYNPEVTITFMQVGA